MMARPQYTVSAPRSGATPAGVFELLRPFGDPEGNPNAIGNYAGTNQVFFVYSPLKTFRVTSMTIEICAESMSEGDFGPGDYGNIEGGLDVGISMGVIDNGVVTTQVPANFRVKTISDWAAITSRNTIFLNKFGVPGLQTEHGMATLTWEVPSYSGAVRIPEGITIGVVLNDDFTSLSSHLFCIQGHEEVV